MIELDHTIFLFFNSHNSPFFDQVMWVVSMKTVWIPLYLAIILFLVLKYRSKVWMPLLFIPLLVLLTDRGSNLIKDIVQRPRPCREPLLEGMVHIVRGSCPGMFGFVSGHAANTFGIAAFSAPLLMKKWYTWSIFAWAALVSYSRIYLGVHYPGDVAGGAILGLMIGAGLALGAKKLLNSMKK